MALLIVLCLITLVIIVACCLTKRRFFKGTKHSDGYNRPEIDKERKHRRHDRRSRGRGTDYNTSSEESPTFKIELYDASKQKQKIGRADSMKHSKLKKPALLFLDEDELKQFDQTRGSTGYTKEGSRVLLADSSLTSLDRADKKLI